MWDVSMICDNKEELAVGGDTDEGKLEKIDKSLGEIVDCGVRYGIEILPLHLLIEDDGDTCDDDSGSGGDCDGGGDCGDGDCGGSDCGGGDCGDGDCGGGDCGGGDGDCGCDGFSSISSTAFSSTTSVTLSQ